MGAKGKKCIFIRYPEHSKGYVLIGERDDGTITELESPDVIFLENEFPSITDVDKDIRLYEMNDPPSIVNRIEENPDLPGISDPSRSQPFYGMTSQDTSIRRSNRISIPRRRFEIEGEAFMVASHDSNEPRTFSEAIASSAKKLWIKAMNERWTP